MASWINCDCFWPPETEALVLSTISVDWSLIAPIIFSISLVESALCSANFLISAATTEKPLPASPALAASMEAFKANKLVWREISLITLIILVISWMLLFISDTLSDKDFISSNSFSQLALTLSMISMLSWFILDDSSASLFISVTFWFNWLMILDNSCSLLTLSWVSWACEEVTSAMPVMVCATSSVALSVWVESSSNESALAATSSLWRWISSTKLPTEATTAL